MSLEMNTSLDLTIGDMMRLSTPGSIFDSLENQFVYEPLKYEQPQPECNVQYEVFHFQHEMGPFWLKLPIKLEGPTNYREWMYHLETTLKTFNPILQSYHLKGFKGIDDHFDEEQRRDPEYNKLRTLVHTFFMKTVRLNATGQPCGSWNMFKNQRDHFVNVIKPELETLNDMQNMAQGDSLKNALMKLSKHGPNKTTIEEAILAITLLPNNLNQMRTILVMMVFKISGVPARTFIKASSKLRSGGTKIKISLTNARMYLQT